MNKIYIGVAPLNIFLCQKRGPNEKGPNIPENPISGHFRGMIYGCPIGGHLKFPTLGDGGHIILHVTREGPLKIFQIAE